MQVTAIRTLQASNGVLQLEEQPKTKQLVHCYQTSWETVLIYQARWAVKCFPSFNCRCVRASGNCKPRGTSVWVLVFLTEQNKHLSGLWMRKVRAHSTHEKLIYFPPKEKKVKENPFKQVSLPSRIALASPFDLRMNQLLLLWRPWTEWWVFSREPPGLLRIDQVIFDSLGTQLKNKLWQYLNNGSKYKYSAASFRPFIEIIFSVTQKIPRK